MGYRAGRRPAAKFVSFSTIVRPITCSLSTKACTIKAFKVGYRRRLVLLINLRLRVELKVDLLGATKKLTGSWNDVKQTTVVKCLRKAGFVVAPKEACTTKTTALRSALLHLERHRQRLLAAAAAYFADGAGAVSRPSGGGSQNGAFTGEK
ncbi:hypothetical protein HPB48_023512 [Haemaphysalis longicornis]|uniref:Uncharacterized protein n=1 Tax=Haemaphysalis longicornis TaxID=44386 RepID=A0A9J6H854_HAELO|nr:hypothetical protein HPB48_023512 [Haemaphysalis longicornis]